MTAVRELSSRDGAKAAFHVSTRLCGREAEVAALENALEHVQGGATEFLGVAGPSGIGKSTLIGELARLGRAARAIRVQGKFDQFQRNRPYTAVLAAFQQIVWRLLAEPEERVARWRQSLTEALSPNAQVLIDFVPYFERILGRQPPVPDLGLAESRIRFNLVIRRFLGCLASAERPLVLILDDVQWADEASLDLIRRVLTDASVSHLLVVAAWRDAEVGRGHPFAQMLAELEGSRVRRRLLELGPLSEGTVREIVRASLPGAAQADELASFVADKTEGNPFFVAELLHAFHRAGLILRSATGQRWRVRLSEVRREYPEPELLDLLLSRRVEHLSAQARVALQLGAIIGHEFDLATLATVLQKPEAAAQSVLGDAVTAGLLLVVDGRDVGDDTVAADAVGAERASGVRYRFPHDRVHRSAYASIAEEERASVHLTVSRLLRARVRDEADDSLFDIADHLNAASAVLDASERLDSAELNLRAARRANASVAYDAARRYSALGRDRVAEQGGWTQHYDLTYGLHLEGVKTAYLLGDYATMHELHDELVAHARTVLDGLAASEIRLQALASSMQYVAAIDSAIPLLRSLDVKLPRHGVAPQVVAGLLKTKWVLMGHDAAGLAELPEMSDPTRRAAMRLMMTVSSAAYATEPNLFPQIVFAMVQTSARHGNSPQSAFGYVCYGLALCAKLGDMEGGLALGRLASAIVERYDARELQAKVEFLYGLFIQPWSEPFDETFRSFRVGASRGLETGDLEYHSYNYYGLDCHRLFAGKPLDALDRSSAAHQESTLALGQEKVSLLMLLVRDVIAALQGADPIRIGELDEAAVVRLCLERRDATSAAYAHFFRCMKYSLLGDHARAVATADACHSYVEGIRGQVFLPLLHFYEALSRIALAREAGASPPSRALKHARELERLARRVPRSFEARAKILTAECERTRGRLTRALTLFEEAIAAARLADNWHDSALAHQLAAECAARAGLATAAEAHFHLALRHWEGWGATALVTALRERDPAISGRPRAVGTAEPTRGSGASGRGASDAATTPDVVAADLEPADLMLEAARQTLVVAGGRRARLALRQAGGDELELRASAELGEGRVEARLETPSPIARSTDLPASALLHVQQTLAPLVIDDVHDDERCRSDPCIARHRIRSLSCHPLLSRGVLVGILCVDDEAAAVFDEASIGRLRELADRLSAPLDNVRLRQTLELSQERQVALTMAHARFVPHPFLAALERTDIEAVRLGDHTEKELSILFSDIRGFTPLVEQMNPQQSIAFINDYLRYMEPAIVQHGGFVDSYIGDAIMALFEEGCDVVGAGVAMLKGLDRFNAERKRQGEPPIAIGVGINTGRLLLGTIGGPNTIKCGVIGDPVNLAARIESLTKHYQVPLVIGQSTLEHMPRPHAYALRPLDRVQVIGHAAPIDVYEVFEADPEPIRDAKRASLDAFEEAIRLYRARQWPRARQLFDHCVDGCPEDHAARRFSHRCEQLQTTPPAPDWDGVDRRLVK